MQRVLLLIFSLLWLGQGMAETLDAPSSPQMTQKEQRDASLDDYHLGTGDKIEIIVYGEDDLSMKLKIGKAGLVNFPYIGEVKLTGRTPSEIETEIEKRLRGDYLLNPMVRSGSTLELIEDVELTHPVNPGDTVIVEQSFF